MKNRSKGMVVMVFVHEGEHNEKPWSTMRTSKVTETGLSYSMILMRLRAKMLNGVVHIIIIQTSSLHHLETFQTIYHLTTV